MDASPKTRKSLLDLSRHLLDLVLAEAPHEEKDPTKEGHPDSIFGRITKGIQGAYLARNQEGREVRTETKTYFRFEFFFNGAWHYSGTFKTKKGALKIADQYNKAANKPGQPPEDTWKLEHSESYYRYVNKRYGKRAADRLTRAIKRANRITRITPTTSVPEDTLFE